MPRALHSDDVAAPFTGAPAEALAGAVRELCPGCGLCCDGVLFTSVRLASSENAAILKEHGFDLEPRADGWSFPQPCRAFRDGCCSIYSSRPGRCRDFHCHLLRRVANGQITPETARLEIRETRRMADRVSSLLAALGDADTALSLSQRCRRRMERISGESDEDLETRAELMLAVNALVCRLGARFYSDPPAEPPP